MSSSESSSITVLVTGAAGFIGREVVSELSSRGHRVIAMVRRSEQSSLFKDKASVTTVVADITDPEAVLAAMQGVSAVVHLAGVVWGETSRMHDTMVDGMRHLLEAMRQMAVPRLILASSLSVYDWAKVQSPLTESSPVSQDSARKQGAYSQTKTEQESMARLLCDRYGIQLTVLRPGGVVSPDNFDAADLGPRIGPVQLVVSPRRRLRIVNVKHVAEAFATACVAKFPQVLTVNLVDDESVTAWQLAAVLKASQAGFCLVLPLPYRGIKGLAHLVYPVAKLMGLERFVPGLLCPHRIACRFKAVDCDTGLWRRYLPLSSSQPFLALFKDSSIALPTGNSQCGSRIL
ncbi:MAG: NAD-dependent epimerase/dehydratase family protein [Gammaproteobacteria bacterium]